MDAGAGADAQRPGAAGAEAPETSSPGAAARSAPVRVDRDLVRSLLTAPGPRDHKYTRGVVQLCTGSEEFPGAAVLSASSAVRAGPGMVRYAGPSTPTALALAARPELVTGFGRSDCVVAGSGIRRLDPDADERAARVLELVGSGVAAVLDAGALGLVAGEPFGTEPGPRLAGAASPTNGRDSAFWGAPKGEIRPLDVVLTPHAGELADLARLLQPGREVAREEVEGDDGWLYAEGIARSTGATVLLKGSATRIVSPLGERWTHESPTSRLAVAGSGDVLAGLIGALVAQDRAHIRATGGRPARIGELAGAGAWIHARAALAASIELAGAPRGEALRVAVATAPASASTASAAVPGAAQRPQAPITALDIVAAVPGVIARLLA